MMALKNPFYDVAAFFRDPTYRMYGILLKKHQALQDEFFA